MVFWDNKTLELLHFGEGLFRNETKKHSKNKHKYHNRI